MCFATFTLYFALLTHLSHCSRCYTQSDTHRQRDFLSSKVKHFLFHHCLLYFLDTESSWKGFFTCLFVVEHHFLSNVQNIRYEQSSEFNRIQWLGVYLEKSHCQSSYSSSQFDVLLLLDRQWCLYLCSTWRDPSLRDKTVCLPSIRYNESKSWERTLDSQIRGSLDDTDPL